MKILKPLLTLVILIIMLIGMSCTTTKHTSKTWDVLDCHPNDRNQRR